MNPISKLGWDWTAASLLLGSVLIASGRLVVTEATDHLFLVAFLAIIGAVFGLVLGYSKFPGWLSAMFGLAYGAFFVPWQLGLAIFADQEWTARLRDLSSRLAFAIAQFTGGEDVADPLLFVTTIGILFWLSGLNAGFRLNRRGDIWGALIPFGLAALIIQVNDDRDFWKAWLLAIFFLSSLLLLARVQQIKRSRSWENSGVYVPFELGQSITRLALIFAVMMVVVAWAAPTLPSTLEAVESRWVDLISPWNDEVSRLLSPLQGGPPRSAGYFGEQLALGRGIPQSTEILFTVETVFANQIPVRLYWRDRVYDIYENGRWSSSYLNRDSWNSIDNEQFVDTLGRTSADFQIIVQTSTSLLHTAPQPTGLDQTVEIAFEENSDSSLDVAALFAQPALVPGEGYLVHASLATPSAEQLRTAGEEYPTWVIERYLQLPINLSPQIVELARNLAEGQETNYDITAAITDYLRTEIEYVDQMPLSPFGRDPIEWALFSQKQGFCNYYASAEVLMLRSLGIPARLAVGYAQGDRQITQENAAYIVRLRDAHAWPEVFFPEIGWVEFEPTANQSPLTRPANNPTDDLSEEELLRLLREELAGPIQPDQTIEAQEVLDANEETETKFNLSWFRSLLAVLTLLGLGLALAWNWNRIQERVSIPALLVKGFTRFDLAIPDPVAEWARYSKLTAIERAYMEINIALIRLGNSPQPGDTPQQRSNSLARLLPWLEEDIQNLSQDYQFRSYSRSKISRDERALKTMRHIYWAARRVQLRTWVGRLGKMFRNK